MNKVWFIFRGDHHLGPFSAREIMRLYKEGKITSETMLWREGDAGWQPLRAQQSLVADAPGADFKESGAPRPLSAALQKKERSQAPAPAKNSALPADLPPLPEVPPPVPPAPEFTLAPASAADQASEISDEFSAGFVSAPTEMHERPQEFAPAPELEVDSFYERAPEQQKNWQRQARIAMAAVATLLLFTFIWQFFFTPVGPFNWAGQSVRRLTQVSRDIEQQLYRFIKEHQGQFKVQLSLTQKGASIWLVSGATGQGSMELKLTSIPGAILGDEDVLALTNAPYFNHAAHFNVFEFVKGQGLLPGRYQAELVYYPSGFWQGLQDELARWRGQIPVPQVLKFEFLYFLGPREDFERALQDYQSKVAASVQKEREKELAPLRHRVEFYSTLIELGEKLIQIYQSEIKEMKSGRDVTKFITRYATEIEPLFRPLTLESKAMSEDPSLSASDRQEWADIHGLYLSLGELVSDIQNMTSRRTSFSGQDGAAARERFVRILTLRANEIANLALEKQSALNNRIESTPN